MKKVLVVDDSLELRSLLKIYLSIYIEDVDAVSSGEEALRYIRNAKVDILISDLEMSNGAGIWLMDELRLIESPPKVVIISGNHFIDEASLISRGAYAFFKKPFEFSDLADFIQKIPCD